MENLVLLYKVIENYWKKIKIIWVVEKRGMVRVDENVIK